MKLFRAPLFHTPENPFLCAEAMQWFADGGIVVDGGRIVDIGEYAVVRRAHPLAETIDRRECLLLPGFVDTHVHFPQMRVIGGMGLPLLPWLEQRVLPEESRLADGGYARQVAREFLQALVHNGTTAALVFGSHFFEAQEIFFAEALASGLSIASGLVVSDRNLRSEMHIGPDAAYANSRRLIERWHGRGSLRYALSPRFAVSAGEGILRVVQALAEEFPDVLIQTHLNETDQEIRLVSKLFPGSQDYLAVYERFGLVQQRTVFAHNLYPSTRELEALATAKCSVAHCPSSNSMLGSGLFSLSAHADQGVTVSLGSDVGAGASLSMFNEALAAYQVQMLKENGYPLTVTHLLYLMTLAGAEALNLDRELGDLSPGKRADLVFIQPPRGSTLAMLWREGIGPEDTVAALFALGREESVFEVYLGGDLVFAR